MMTPEIDYLERIKPREGEFQREHDQVVQLKDGVSFGEFIEAVQLPIHVFDHTSLYFTDTEWEEEGSYRTGVIQIELFQQLEEWLAARRFLKSDEFLRPTCFVSINSGRQEFVFLPRKRPNLMVDVAGGQRDNSGKFLAVLLDDPDVFLETANAREYLDKIEGAG